jgi:diaminohydroxyphosphoribosylaminopyrimidine deaminase/5-amino-6-(5-phosphoribosylamino)uracil reductase
MNINEHYMDLALKLAQSAVGQTEPNPLVGAVIVKDGEMIGMGAHLKAGTPHAEVHALQMAGEKAKGATAYVTLEPCSHTGRTGPCAEALVRAGIAKVVVAALDPNPLVAGGGVAILREAGLEVVMGVREQESKRMNEIFNKYIVTKKPFVTVKTAMTLDGKIAAATGDSRWVTGEAARQDVHLIRHQTSAILVGINTVLEDDPQLTTRNVLHGKNPIRVVLDSKLHIPLSSKVVTDGQAPTWIFTSCDFDQEKKLELERRGVRVFVTSSAGAVDIQEMLSFLGEQQIASLLVEGGGSINFSFLREKAVDKVISYIAPKLIGGKDALTPFTGEGFDKMSDAIELSELSFEKVGEDLRITGYPVNK